MDMLLPNHQLVETQTNDVLKVFNTHFAPFYAQLLVNSLLYFFNFTRYINIDSYSYCCLNTEKNIIAVVVKNLIFIKN